MLWQGIALAGAALDEDRRSEWLRAWATIGGSFVANQAIKYAVRRPRPDDGLMHTMSNRSYPSAHATTAACGARVLSPLTRLPLQPLAVAMAWSRMYLGVHWPSDVVAGYALGSAIGELAS